MATNTIDILKRARALVERGWCQGTYSRDERGVASLSKSQDCSWCSVGALDTAAGSDSDKYLAAYDELATAITPGGDVGVVKWNDAPGRTQAEVLAMFDRAIASLEAAK